MNRHIIGSNSYSHGDSGGPVFDLHASYFLGIAVGNQVYHDDQNKLGLYGSKYNIVPAIILE